MRGGRPAPAADVQRRESDVDRNLSPVGMGCLEQESPAHRARTRRRRVVLAETRMPAEARRNENLDRIACQRLLTVACQSRARVVHHHGLPLVVVDDDHVGRGVKHRAEELIARILNRGHGRSPIVALGRDRMDGNVAFAGVSDEERAPAFVPIALRTFVFPQTAGRATSPFSPFR